MKVTKMKSALGSTCFDGHSQQVIVSVFCDDDYFMAHPIALQIVLDIREIKQ